MKKLYFLLFTFLISVLSFAQSVGDFAFIGFNADGDDDFALVALADIPANSTIYFSDDELNGSGGFVDSNEGNIQWDTPASVITAGTVVVFTDTDSGGNASFGVSLGTLTYVGSGTVNLAGGGDSLLAYLGTDENTPTTFIAGIENSAGIVGDLTGSGLTGGSTFITINTGGTPDGGEYSGARDSETAFANYITLISDPLNWTIDAGNGESLLPFDTTAFSEAATATPTITVGNAVTGLDYFDGNGPSASGTFTVSGLNLTANILVSAPSSEFELSLDDATFTPTVTVTQTAGTAATTTVYVRLAAGLAVNPYSGDATATSTGATDKTVALSGTVSPADPQMTITGFVGDLDYEFGTGPSNEDSFNVEGLFLTENILVTAPTNFEVSLTTGTGFASSVSVPFGSGTVASTEIFVRLVTGLAVGPYSGDVTASSAGATNQTIAISGNVTPAATCSNVGDIIITEVMQNPSASGADPAGEYIELYNTTGANIDIAGWIIKDDLTAAESHTISSTLIVPATGYIVIGNVATTTPALDYNYANNISLGNGTDGVILECSSTIIDQVIWDDGSTFPDPTAASMELSTLHLNSTDNDTGANWGTATTDLGNGDLGTPGAANGFTLSAESFESLSFNIYPNPTNTGFVNITSVNSEVIDAKVFDILGKEVLKGKVENNQLNVSNLNAGMYIMRLSQNNATVTKKLVIQ